MKLVVTQAFGDYPRGAEITDAKAMEEAQASNPHCVVRVQDHDPTDVREPRNVQAD